MNNEKSRTSLRNLERTGPPRVGLDRAEIDDGRLHSTWSM
jgi:hypothetical protein